MALTSVYVINMNANNVETRETKRAEVFCTDCSCQNSLCLSYFMLLLMAKIDGIRIGLPRHQMLLVIREDGVPLDD